MQEQQKTMQEHMKQMGAGMDGKMGRARWAVAPKPAQATSRLQRTFR